MSNVGIVVIGRNEHTRLGRCLASADRARCPLVYVDSGSTDGSPDVARSRGADVIELDRTAPFTAARGRNTGYRHVREHFDGIEYVQFVDGDCELCPGWIEQATGVLSARPEVDVVCGGLRERRPEASIFNQLCDIEWSREDGDIDACGGVFMIRTETFDRVGGFNATLAAGEEPDLCQRIREQGGGIVRLADQMAWHDAAMLTIGQWWRREVRTGLGGYELATRALRRLYGRSVWSARIWTVGWVLAVAVGSTVVYRLAGGVAATVTAAIIASLLPIQMLRVARVARSKGYTRRVSLLHGCFTMIGKWPQLVGQGIGVRRRLSPDRPATSVVPVMTGATPDPGGCERR